MPSQVHRRPSAAREFHHDLRGQVLTELGQGFPLADAVSEYDILQGFNADQQKKLILAVETQNRQESGPRPHYETHLVKPG
jgi:hypothetical protein